MIKLIYFSSLFNLWSPFGLSVVLNVNYKKTLLSRLYVTETRNQKL